MGGSLQPPSTFRIDAAKITAYLLNPDHPAGGPKAAFFIDQGFRVGRPDELADALLAHAHRSRLVEAENNGFVDKVIYEGDLSGPNGPIPRVRSVWKVVPGNTYGELVTAHRF